ncbi:SF3b10-domain-containing protein [Jaminaea rosea]|uniref:SF3b10-domain-containing protein n=1 Tax=Jaminaea rosea TaxID=1569628 RepID=A0A316UPN8_9BASI|nr:SF3b10-domain-containing protein [Jaminaea rosea]PWN27259.1 SF3b10-domain-containing protein [Jaminaea rosea]
MLTKADTLRLLLLFSPLLSMSDSAELKYTSNQQLEHLHARYVGTIHPDITKHEWLVHQHRDTAASIVGHPMLHSFIALAEGESKARVAAGLKEKMMMPCGPRPEMGE